MSRRAGSTVGRSVEWSPTSVAGHALLLLLPLAIRLIVTYQLTSNAFDQVPIVDAETYDAAAQRIASGTFSMAAPFWQPPFYEFFLASIYGVLGHSYGAVRVVQSFIGAGSCVLVFLLTRRLFGLRPAWIAYAMASLCGPMIFHDHELLPASLFIALELVLLWGCGRDTITTKVAFGLGVVLGLAAITVQNILLAAPLFVAYLVRKDHGPGVSAFRLPAVCALGAALVIAPVTIANFEASRELVTVAASGGINFFIGNNPDYDGTLAIRPGYQWKKLDLEPSVEAGAVSSNERASFYVGKSIAWMKQDPAAFLRLLGKKALLLVAGTEVPRNQEIYPSRDDSSVLAALLWCEGLAFPLGLLFPLAVVGMIGSRKAAGDARLRRLMLAYAGVYALSVVAFFVTSRHRLPLVPLLLPFSAFAVHRIVEQVKTGPRSALALSSLLLGGLLLLSNVAKPKPVTEYGSGTLTELAFHHLGAGEGQMAEEILEHAVRIDPHNVDAAVALARRYVDTQQTERAISPMVGLASIFPALGLADLARFGGRDSRQKALHVQQTLAELEPLAQLWPETAEAHLRLAERLAADGAVNEADGHRGVAAEIFAAIGLAHNRAAHFDQAQQSYEKALTLRPLFAQALVGLGLAHASRGDLAKAVEMWTRAKKLDPSDPRIDEMLAMARPGLELAKRRP